MYTQSVGSCMVTVICYVFLGLCCPSYSNNLLFHVMFLMPCNCYQLKDDVISSLQKDWNGKMPIAVAPQISLALTTCSLSSSLFPFMSTKMESTMTTKVPEGLVELNLLVLEF